MRLKKILFLCVFTISAVSVGTVQAQRPVPTNGKASAPAAAQMRTIDIIGTDDMKYNLTSITAKPGEKIRIRMITRGTIPKVAMAHNVVVLKAETDVLKFLSAGAAFRETDFIAPAMQNMVIAKTPFAGPGEAVQVVFTVPGKPGRYPYICTFAGHYQAGMKGTLIVK
jgi:azurin